MFQGPNSAYSDFVVIHLQTPYSLARDLFALDEVSQIPSKIQINSVPLIRGLFKCSRHLMGEEGCQE